MTYRITAPEAAFGGEVAGMRFAAGVAVGDPSAAALAYFRRRGYGVEEVEEAEAPAQDPAPAATDDTAGEAAEMPARSASKAAWRAYAVARGMSDADADAATRDQLAERFHGQG